MSTLNIKKMAESLEPRAGMLPNDPYFGVLHFRALRRVKDEDNISDEELEELFDDSVGLLAEEINDLQYDHVQFVHPGYTPWTGEQTDIYWYEGILLRVTFQYRADLKSTFISFDCMVRKP